MRHPAKTTLVMAFLFLSACGGSTDGGTSSTDGGTGSTDGGTSSTDGGQTACSAETCEGCCDGDVCRAGTAEAACGSGGEACSVCDAGDACTAGVCEPTGCGPETCPDGCCQGDTCVTGTSTDACGAGGDACADCGGGACVAQACLASCPTGASDPGDGTCVCDDARYELSDDGTACVPAAEWTILVFMAADNNLEPFGLSDVAEMAAGIGSDRVNVVVQLDRAMTYSTDELPVIGAQPEARRFAVTPSGLVALGDSLGETNTGDPAVLTDFVGWGLEAFPAKRSGLVLWDHGGAWLGFGGDESANHDGLTLAELQEGIQQGLSAAGASRLDLLGFDACLMASLEVATSVAPLARFLVASEEVEPGEGWNYEPVMAGLSATPEMDPQAFGMLLVDEYFHQFDGNPMKQSGVTLSLIDGDAVTPLLLALSALTSRLEQHVVLRAPWLEVARSYTRSQSFVFNDSSYFVRDLGDFVFALQGQVTDPEAQTLLATTIDAYAAAVPYQLSGMARPGATGLTAFMPATNEQMDAARLSYGANSPLVDHAWPSFVETYLLEAAKDLSPPVLGPVTVNRTLDDVQVGGSVVADDLRDLYLWTFAQVDTKAVFLRRAPAAVDELGNVHESYDYTATVLADKTSASFAPALYDYESWAVAAADPGDSFDTYAGAILARVSNDNGASWVDGYFAVAVDEPTGLHEIGPFYVESRGDIGEFQMKPGYQVEPLWVVTENGSTQLLGSGQILTVPFGGLTLTHQKVDEQLPLYIGLSATDFVGNEASAGASQPVTVPGTACSDHTPCDAEAFCDFALGECRPVYGTTFELAPDWFTLAATKDDGTSWDAFGGAPDPFVEIAVGGSTVGYTATTSDTYDGAFTGSTTVQFAPGDTIVLYVWDEDVTDADYVGGVEWIDPVQVARDGFGYYTAPSGQLEYLDFLLTPR